MIYLISGLVFSLIAGGCSFKKYLDAKADIRLCQKSHKVTQDKLTKLTKNWDASLERAAAKGCAGKKQDKMERKFKWKASECRKLLKKEAMDIARQNAKLVK